MVSALPPWEVSACESDEAAYADGRRGERFWLLGQIPDARPAHSLPCITEVRAATTNQPQTAPALAGVEPPAHLEPAGRGKGNQKTTPLSQCRWHNSHQRTWNGADSLTVNQPRTRAFLERQVTEARVHSCIHPFGCSLRASAECKIDGCGQDSPPCSIVRVTSATPRPLCARLSTLTLPRR